jgi:hypothetical protein
MNRNVYAILISVPQSAEYQTTTIPDADEAVERFRVMLDQRFHEKLVVASLKRPDATQDKVCQAFEGAVGHLAGGDLFIILFIGHGLQASDTHAYQAWALDDSEFTDRQLAGYLARLKRNVEVVIISDSCYGAGIAAPGPTALRFASRPFHAMIKKVRALFYRLPFMRTYHRRQLPELANAWSSGELEKVATRPDALTRADKLVCIAAASWWDQVDPYAMKDLIDMTIDAVEANCTHGALADAFDERAASGATFQLIVRPNDRMCTRLLAPQTLCLTERQTPSLTEDPESPVPPNDEVPEPPPLTRYLFINYNKAASCKVRFTAVDDPRPGLQEIIPTGAPPGATIEEVPGTHDYVLSLEPQAIAGFLVRFNVTFSSNAMAPGIGVITWRGKDPPVPPPPKGLLTAGALTKYADMVTFEDRFKALLTVGAAEPRPAVPGVNGASMTGANGASANGASPLQARPEVVGSGAQLGSICTTDRDPRDAIDGGAGGNEYTMLLMVARRGA